MVTAQNVHVHDEYLCNSGKLTFFLCFTPFEKVLKCGNLGFVLRDWAIPKNLPIRGQNQRKIGKNYPD